MSRSQAVLVTVRSVEGSYVAGSSDQSPDQKLYVGLIAVSPSRSFDHVVGEETLLIRDDADLLRSVASGGDEDAHRDAGQITFDLMFPKGRVREAWSRILADCESAGRDVRLFVDLPASLAWIPLELAVPDDDNPRSLVRRDGISVARWIPNKRAHKAPGDGKFRAMVVGGAPLGREPFGGIEDWKVELVEDVRKSHRSGAVVCEKIGIEQEEVRASAGRYGPFDVLVLAVHGDVTNGVPQIYLGDRQGNPLAVTAEVFMERFGAARCVILLACHSASTPSPNGTGRDGDDLAGYSFARALAEAGVEATVGFVGKEKWEQARAIGASIVKSLAGGNDIYSAVRQARQQSEGGYSWGRLRLFAGGEGRFTGDEAGGQELLEEIAPRLTPKPMTMCTTTDDDPGDAQAVSVAHDACSVPVGVIDIGSRPHVYSVSGGNVVHRPYERIADIPLPQLGVRESIGSESFALSPTGKLAVSLTGNQLQLARVSSTTGLASLTHPRPFTLGGDPLRLVAIDDPRLVNSSSTTCLVSYATETQCVFLDTQSGLPDVVKTFEGSAIDGILSRETVVMLHDDGADVDGDAFDFCRPGFLASRDALRAIDFVRLGSERFVLAVYDDRLTVFGSILRRSVDSGTLAGLVTAVLVRPGRGVFTVTALGVTTSGARLFPVPD